MKKFALISVALPPSQQGQSTILFHLLKDLDPRKFCLITQKNFYLYSKKTRGSPQLPAKYFFLQPEYLFIRTVVHVAFWAHSTTLMNFILKIRTIQIKKIILKEHCDVIVACTGDLFDPLAAFNVSKDLNIPFVLYAFDYYSYQPTIPFLRAFAAKYEPELVQGAVNVVVPNECMHEEYLKRYSIDAMIIRNPCDIVGYEKQAQIKRNTNNENKNTKTIIYTGAVYDAHYDTFRNLITAIKSLKHLNLVLHIYTPHSQRSLTENNITGPVIVHEAQPVIAMPAIQRNADILFLPLSFGSPYPELIRTSSPAKLGEYLASKRPILVHAPKNSFVSWYFRKFRCGLVVDEENPELLADAIQNLINDKDLCREITENAYLRAKIDFDINIVQKNFLKIFE